MANNTYLVAFAGKPSAAFLPALREACAAEGVNLLAAKIASGPGCYNLGVKLNTPNERFMKSLAMALMPSKWCDCIDVLEDGSFVDEVNA